MVDKTTTIDQLRAMATARQNHARKCQKSPDECETCQRNVKWFGELDVMTLSRVLEE